MVTQQQEEEHVAEMAQYCFNSSFKLIDSLLYMHSSQSLDKAIKWILVRFLPLQRFCAGMK